MQPTPTIPRPTSDRIAVAPGTAEQLARLSHFRRLEIPQTDELDAVALFLIGNVGSSFEKQLLWERLQDDCLHLFHVITSDWDEDDLDELREEDWARWSMATPQQELGVRHGITWDRLIGDIENAVYDARVEAVKRPKYQDGAR